MNIRTFEPNDIQYVIQSHMEIYAKEHRFDATFRNYVSDAAYQFLETFNSERENLWIVEYNGKLVGSIAIVQVTATMTGDGCRSHSPAIDPR